MNQVSIPTATAVGIEITYGPMILPNGLKVHPDNESVLQLLLDGASVFVLSEDHYTNLYRAFKRLAKREKIRDKRLGRAQVNAAKWQLLVLPLKSKERPLVPFEKGFLRKHGLYKKWAIDLHQSGAWHSSDLSEVKKVMAAWRLYTPLVDRKDKRLMCKQTGRSWTVSILAKK